MGLGTHLHVAEKVVAMWRENRSSDLVHGDSISWSPVSRDIVRGARKRSELRTHRTLNAAELWRDGSLFPAWMGALLGGSHSTGSKVRP